MKHTIMAVLAIAVSALQGTTAHGQDLRFGVTAGGLMTKYSLKDLSDERFEMYDISGGVRGGLTIGGIANIAWDNGWMAEGRLKYSYSHARINQYEGWAVNNICGTHEPYGGYTYRTNTLSLPLMGGYALSLGNIRLYGMAGPSVNYQINPEIKIDEVAGWRGTDHLHKWFLGVDAVLGTELGTHHRIEVAYSTCLTRYADFRMISNLHVVGVNYAYMF